MGLGSSWRHSPEWAEESHYELLELIGSGGMGHVYRARHHPSGRLVAAKVPHRDLPDELRHLLLREAAAVARLHHPHIVELVDVVDGPVLVMELVEGSDLRGYQAVVSSWVPGVNILIQVLEGLAAAHAEGIVHGDLKPANVLVRADGQAKVADFGLAQLVDPLRRSKEARKAAGTPAYMAPEQFGDGEELGPWTDLYAVGVILYQMLHGQVPHDGTLPELVAQKLSGQVPEHPLRPGMRVEPALLQLMMRLLRSHPRQRPRFAREVRDELSALVAFADEPTIALGVEDAPTEALAPTLFPPAHGEATEAWDDTFVPSEPTLELPHRVTAAGVVGQGLFHLRTPMLVGRTAEQSRLRGLMTAVAAEGKTRVVVLTGAAGTGKTALARWGLSEAERTATMEGAAAGYDLSGGGMTGGLKLLLRRLLDSPLAPPETEGDKMPWAWLGDGFDVEQAWQWLEQDRGIASDDDLKLVRDVLRTAARRRPVYLWLDDVGWSRDGALDLVDSLLKETPAPVLVVLTLRSGTAGHPWVAARLAALEVHAQVERLELGALSPVASVELLEQVVPLVAELSEALMGHVQGSAKRVIGRARSWVDRGWLRPSPLGWACAPEVRVEHLLGDTPESDVVALRIAALSHEGASITDDVLLRAALLGFSFEEPLLLASFAPGERKAVRGVLGRALLEGILSSEPMAQVYRFESDVVHGHLLDRVGAGGRAEAAARVLARTLETVFGEGDAAVGARTAYLHRLAGARATSYAVLREAVARLGRRGLSDRAEELAAVARAWGQADAPIHARERVDVILAQAFFHYYALRYAETLRFLAEAKAELAREPDAERSAIALNLEMTTHYYANRLGTAARMAEEAGKLWEGAIEAGLWRSVFISHLLRSELLGLAGRHDEAVTQTEWGLQRFALSPVLGHRVSIWIVHCEQLVAAGRLEEAVQLAKKLRVEAATTHAMKDDLLDLVARVDAFVGQWDLARFTSRLDVAERHGDPWRATAHRVYIAWHAAVHADDDAAALAVEMMLAAYASDPQEEAMTTLALGRMASALSQRGQRRLAERVNAVVEARHLAIARGFER